MRNASKVFLLAGITSAALAAPIAHAQAPAAAAPATPEHTLTGNFGIFSEYIFRGIAQTAGKPAIQGGFDYAHSSGLYLGTWASNVSWLGDFGAYSKSSLEWDVYGGYKGTFADDFSYDVGLLYYYYPGTANPGIIKADTLEGYVGIGWKFLSAKLSYNFDDYFGARPAGEKTDGTWYLDLSAAYPLGDSGASLVAHYGILDVKNDGSGSTEASYEDWKIGVAYVIADGFMKGAEVGAYYSGNNATEAFYTDLNGYNTANPGIVKADTLEGYVGIGWKFLSAKISYNFDDYFGARPAGQSTDGTWYLDLSAAYPLGDSGASIVAHYGILDVKNDGSGSTEASYEDWKLGVAYVIPDGFMKGAEVGAYYSGNNATEAFYTDLNGYNTARDRGVVYIKKTF